MAATCETGVVPGGARRPHREADAAGAARRLLRSRLTVVGRELARVAAGRVASEDVHRLRVAVRRATATIDALKALLPRRGRRWFRKTLRTIRRAAGPTRDLDVIVAGLQAVRGGSPAPSVAAFLPRALARRRAAAERQLERFARGFQHDAWRRRIGMATESVRGSEATVQRRLHGRVRALVAKFLRRADRRMRRGRAVHRMRIAAKKLRYALEATSSITPIALGDACERLLLRVQDRFGKATDRAAIVAALRRWADDEPDPRRRREVVRLRHDESRREKKARRACCRWWTSSQRHRIVKALAATTRRGSS